MTTKEKINPADTSKSNPTIHLYVNRINTDIHYRVCDGGKVIRSFKKNMPGVYCIVCKSFEHMSPYQLAKFLGLT